MVTDTGQVLDTAAANHNDGVLLQVVADTGNVGGHFVTVGETNTGDLTQSGVRLLRSRGTHSGADAALLGRRLVGLKENVIIGKLIPAGSGLDMYRNFEMKTDESIEDEADYVDLSELKKLTNAL